MSKSKHVIFLLVAYLSMLSMTAQDTITLASFKYSDYADWIYTRSDVELSGSNISMGRITLWNDGGRCYRLLSPKLEQPQDEPVVQAGDSLLVTVRMRYSEGLNSDFNWPLSQLTIALIDADTWATIDSVRCPVPATPSRDATLQAQLPLTADVAPLHGTIRVALSAWKADVLSTGAVKNVTVECLTGARHIRGDVNGDGIVNIVDANAVIALILNESSGDNATRQRADVNEDSVISIGDANAIINIILQS